MTRIYYIINVILCFPVHFFQILKLSNEIKKQFENGDSNIDRFRNNKIRLLLETANKVEFYKDFFQKKKKYVSISNFPLISKEIIRNSSLSIHLNSNFIPHTSLNTGGSSGKPFNFYTDLNCRVAEYAHQLFFYRELGFRIFDKIYSFGGPKISENKIKRKIYWKRKLFGFPFGKVIFSSKHLNDNTIEYYVNQIIQDKPQFLRGYPSSFLKISSYLKSRNESINFIKGILLTSELISSSDIQLIKSVFNCKVIPQYGHTENSIFAFTEEDSLKYYCSPFYGITEVVNTETGLHVSKGEMGEIVVTSLSNNYQPFIRYRTEDMAIYGGEKNGFVILENLLGRSQDFIYDKNKDKILLVGLIFGSHTKLFHFINDWQFTQNLVGVVEINILPNEKWNYSIHETLVYDLFKSIDIKLNINYEQDLIKTNAGKRKFLIQNI